MKYLETGKSLIKGWAEPPPQSCPLPAEFLLGGVGDRWWRWCWHRNHSLIVPWPPLSPDHWPLKAYCEHLTWPMATSHTITYQVSADTQKSICIGDIGTNLWQLFWEFYIWHIDKYIWGTFMQAPMFPMWKLHDVQCPLLPLSITLQHLA